MSKVTLKFNLSDQTEKEEYLRCLKADDMASVLFNLTQYKGKTWRKEMYKLMQEKGINLEEIYR